MKNVCWVVWRVTAVLFKVQRLYDNTRHSKKIDDQKSTCELQHVTLQGAFVKLPPVVCVRLVNQEFGVQKLMAYKQKQQRDESASLNL